MSLRFAYLGSGSRGNALVVEASEGAHTTRVLLDCGFGTRETAQRLGRLGLAIEDIHAVLVTHEHSDHAAGVFKLCARAGIPAFLTHGTLVAAPRGRGEMPTLNVIDSHAAFAIGCLQLTPFPVPHDAREPVQYVFGDGARRLGVVTDLGHPTPHVRRMLDGVDALALECNHDLAMLAAGRYPPSLSKRIAGPYGHLDNAAAASLLAGIDRTRLQHVVAVHLSEENNRPALARAALAQVLGCAEDWVAVATQEEGSAWRAVG